ncbi:MAG: hypothetical protein LAN71_13360 [Acidobacteriia bacterium]|nr:hypothetical protein [Terriglobia bacterium]
MNHARLHRHARNILILCALFTLAAAWAGHGAPAGAAPRTSSPAPVWRLLAPVSYENITLFPVVSAADADTSAFLTLDQGLASGEVMVSEQGAEGMARSRDSRHPTPPDDYRGASVNNLVLINRGKRPLLLLAGELVSGGKQDRVIAKDRIVPPGSAPLPLDVFCVEHGRWSSGANFSASKIIVHPSVREKAAIAHKQAEVWAAVSSGSTAEMRSGGAAAAAPSLTASEIARTIAADAPTQSYAKIYQESGAGASVDSFSEELRKRFAQATAGLKGERVVGVIVAYGGEVAWSDIFASGALFEQYSGKLLRSYSVEALARPGLRETATVESAREFLRRPAGHEQEESEPGVYRVREISEGHLSLVELESLAPKPLLLHRLLVRRTS